MNVQFKIKNGSLYFHDVLSFGTLNIINDNKLLNKKLSIIGPDVMDISFNIFNIQILKKNNLKKEIGIVLMNQKIILNNNTL